MEPVVPGGRFSIRAKDRRSRRASSLNSRIHPSAEAFDLVEIRLRSGFVAKFPFHAAALAEGGGAFRHRLDPFFAGRQSFICLSKYFLRIGE